MKREMYTRGDHEIDRQDKDSAKKDSTSGEKDDTQIRQEDKEGVNDDGDEKRTVKKINLAQTVYSEGNRMCKSITQLLFDA